MTPDQRLPLHEWHATHGASFTSWLGWELPESYGASQLEYEELREGCAVIDASHLLRLRVEGDSAERFLNEVLTLDVTRIRENCSAYSFLCNVRGGIEEGFLVYRDPRYFLLLGNSPRRRHVLDLIDAEVEKRLEWDVEVTNVTQSQAEAVLRGPGAKAVLETVFLSQALPLDPGKANVVELGSNRVLALRAPAGGNPMYHLVTGIAGFEDLWQRIYRVSRSARMRPVGIAAREVFRIEMATGAPESEWDGRTTPFELGEEGQVSFHKAKFLGKRALLHSSTDEFSRRLVLVRFEQNFQPKAGMELLSAGIPVGKLTSTAHSPAWRGPVGLGFVHWMKSTPGTMLEVMDEKEAASSAEVVSPEAVSATR